MPIWQDECLTPLPHGLLLDLAVIWDEDHDERVIEVVEALYFGGLLAPVRFIDERKGSLSVLIDVKTMGAWDEVTLGSYRDAVSDISQGLEDPWPTTVDQITGRNHSIIHAAPDDVATYLKNIHLLWQLGEAFSLKNVNKALKLVDLLTWQYASAPESLAKCAAPSSVYATEFPITVLSGPRQYFPRKVLLKQ